MYLRSRSTYLDANKNDTSPKNFQKLILIKTGQITIQYHLKVFRDHLMGHKLCMFIYSHNGHTPGLKTPSEEQYDTLQGDIYKMNFQNDNPAQVVIV